MLNLLDLFSGIGGFSHGLEKTGGFQTLAFCENDKVCQKVLKKHWPYTHCFEDIRLLKGQHGHIAIESGSTVIHERIDVLCGGFPCQDISVAGNKKGFEDEKEVLSVFESEFERIFRRHHGHTGFTQRDISKLCKEISGAGKSTKAATTRSGLWKEYLRLIKEIKPRYAIIENVANLRNEGLSQIIKDLWSVGYACEWHIISARSIGACHLRERIWIIAYPNSERIRISESKERNKNLLIVGTCEEAGIKPSYPQVDRDKRNGSTIYGKEGKEQEAGRPKFNSCSSNVETSNSNVPRFWRAFASEKEKHEWWTETASGFRDVFGKIHEVESTIYRGDDGVPGRLDERARKERVKQVGNSVLPQIPEIIGNMILEWEELNK